MRILILTAIPFWHPGTQELINHLRERGIQVSALDIFHGMEVNEKNEIVNLIPFGLKGFLARVYMKLFRKHFVHKHTKDADIIDLHFVEPAYSKYIPDLDKKFICTLFGSDLFRTSDTAKNDQRILFDTCDRILLSKNMVAYFEEHFGAKPEKYQFNQYGSARIDSVYEALSSLNRAATRQKWSIPQGATIVTIGYNGKPEQQHLKILDQLKSLPPEEKKSLFLIFPMTYGGTAEYHNQVDQNAEDIGNGHRVLLSRLSDKEITELRIISDITINTQTTDALASSVKEAMVSGDIMLVGEWLPYDIYRELGVHFLSTNFTTLRDDFVNSLRDVDKLRELSVKNAEIIRKFASWNVLIDQWISDYDQLHNES